MKIAIKQTTLVNALEKGAMAALSDEAQADTSIIALILKSVNLKVDNGNFIVESGTKLLSSRFSIPVTIENGIEVKEEGEILVSAKELYDWAKRQPNAKLAISLKKLDTPEIINPLSAESNTPSAKGIKKIGIVRIASKDETKTGSKWSLDCYESGQVGLSKIVLPKEAKFEITVSQLRDALKNISISIMSKHYEHLYDAIAFQSYDKGGISRLFSAASDAARISTYEMTTAKSNTLNYNLMIPCSVLTDVSKLAEETGIISVSHDKDANRIYIDHKNQGTEFTIKTATTDVDKAKKFPAIEAVLEKEYKIEINVSKSQLLGRLSTSCLINNEINLFLFKDNLITIHSISASGKAPVTCVMPVKDLKFENKLVLSPSHILDIGRVLKDDNIKMLFSENKAIHSIKIVSSQDSNLIHIILLKDLAQTKYSQVNIEELA